MIEIFPVVRKAHVHHVSRVKSDVVSHVGGFDVSVLVKSALIKLGRRRYATSVSGRFAIHVGVHSMKSATTALIVGRMKRLSCSCEINRHRGETGMQGLGSTNHPGNHMNGECSSLFCVS
jgi:hypothetical protein